MKPRDSQLTEGPFLAAMKSANSEDALFAELALALRDAAQADSVNVLQQVVGEGLILRASTDMPEMNNRFRLAKGKGVAALAVESGEPVFIGKSLARHPKFVIIPGSDADGYESLAVLPFFEGEGMPAGVVTFKRSAPWRFTPTTKRKLAQLVALASIAAEAYHTIFREGARVNRLGALSEVSRIISSSPYLEEILQLLVNLTAQQFNYVVCTVRLLDESRGELVLRATQSTVKAYHRKRAIHIGESIAGRAIAEGRPIIVPDVQVEEDYIGHELAVEQGLRSMICVPLSIQDRAIGVLSCYTDEVRVFNADEVAALETLAKHAAYAVEHAKFQVRDTLMQEMHHRVKNNLQQVASLMRLQLRHKQYKSLEEALNDTLARILAIAAVHDLLSREDLDHVSIKNVAESLVQHQVGSLMLPDKRILFDVRGDEVTLNMTQATQIALVLNELILNAIEHGFKSTDDGEVHITIEERDREVALWVANNGDELPTDFDLAFSSHLGLQIVDNLARALSGRFKISNILGWTVAELKFARSGGE